MSSLIVSSGESARHAMRAAGLHWAGRFATPLRYSPQAGSAQTRCTSFRSNSARPLSARGCVARRPRGGLPRASHAGLGGTAQLCALLHLEAPRASVAPPLFEANEFCSQTLMRLTMMPAPSRARGDGRYAPARASVSPRSAVGPARVCVPKDTHTLRHLAWRQLSERRSREFCRRAGLASTAGEPEGPTQWLAPAHTAHRRHPDPNKATR